MTKGSSQGRSQAAGTAGARALRWESDAESSGHAGARLGGHRGGPCKIAE